MSSPLQFGGPVSLPADPTTSLGAATKQYADAKIPFSYFTLLATPAGVPENMRIGSISQTIPYWSATSATTTSVKTVTALFPVGWDAGVTSKVVTGFQFWVSTAPSAAVQSGAFAVYTGSTNSTLNRVGSNGSFSLALSTTGMKQVPFASTITISGQSIGWIAVQFSLSAPASGAGGAIACTPTASSGLTSAGGKYGEWTGSTVVPGATLDASAASSSAVLGQLVWVSLY